MARRAWQASQDVRWALGGLALAGVALGLLVATHDGHSAEKAIERREQQMFRHCARLESVSRAWLRAGARMQEYARPGGERASSYT